MVTRNNPSLSELSKASPRKTKQSLSRVTLIRNKANDKPSKVKPQLKPAYQSKLPETEDLTYDL